MTEQEKRAEVIKGLEICTDYDNNCAGCPYRESEHDCAYTLKQNALALLKAQEQEPRLHAHWEYKERHRLSFKQYTGFDNTGETHTITVREESEGKEPYCSNCGAQAAESFMDYCPHCGAIMDETDNAGIIKALGIIEDVLDDLIEAGNGTTDQMLHADADKLFALRYFLTAVFDPEKLTEEYSQADKKHWEAIP